MSVTSSVIVCDQGSHMMKCGFAGSDFPQHLIPSVIGTSIGGTLEQIQNTDFSAHPFVGDDALKTNSVDVRYLVSPKAEVGKIYEMEFLWTHIFRKLRKWDLTDCKIILSKGQLTSQRSQNVMKELLFEYYGVTAVHFVSPSAALYAQGLLSGIVVDCGESTEVSAFYDGEMFPYLGKRLNMGGRDMIRFLSRMLVGHGYKERDSKSLRNFIENQCYVALDPTSEKILAAETCCLDTQYTLPDGQTITLNKERFLVPEILFEPWLYDISSQGISELLARTILDCDSELRLQLSRNIVLCGGCSLFPGMASRLEKELISSFSRQRYCSMKSKDIKVIDPPHREFLMYTGASILGKIAEDNDKFWTSREDYLEANNKNAMPEFDLE